MEERLQNYIVDANMIKVAGAGGTVYYRKVTAQKNRALLTRMVEVIGDQIQDKKVTRGGRKQRGWKCKYERRWGMLHPTLEGVHVFFALDKCTTGGGAATVVAFISRHGVMAGAICIV